MELFVRKANTRLYERDWEALQSNSDPQQRSLINLTAFRAVVMGYAAGSEYNLVREFVTERSNLRNAEVCELGANILSDPQLGEAADLAGRIASNLFVLMQEPIVLEPRFAGCGLINSCRGDALTQSLRMIELKDGDRPFRAYEFRQLSCYAALHLNATDKLPKSLIVINSRRGVRVEIGIEDFAREVAGQSAINYLREIIRVLSDVTISG